MTDLLRGISIFLIGMMGTGKTTVGQLLAQELNYRFFDTDVLVERVEGQSISEIFARQGEEPFRKLESLILAQLCAETRSIIATGGGIVLRPQNWSYLRHGLVIWLDAPVTVLVKRLAADNTRPLLQEKELEGRLTQLLAVRQSLYGEADLHIPVDIAQTPPEIVTAILEALPTVLKSPYNPESESLKS